MDLQALNDFWCWSCMEQAVRKPGELCARCARNQAHRFYSAGKRTTVTHDDTHDDYRADFDETSLDQLAFSRWWQAQD